ncbi:sugar transferase [Aggregicoccus sp. 17bor-14]|uniref:sugar transferase n=1 Tax=Myxococcaceae TaxID=31 RepID=UPI00129CB255|nr:MULTISPECIES: sugar transferase [Myxococcaceae]MBF5042592.1 sugar transferase [Simulacricoccus sp. 17bor-14]MRI88361.1 sugar transferase [Aggregicoccus sp. 17bor-14]
MSSSIGTVAPGAAAKVNLILDVLTLLFAIVLATPGSSLSAALAEPATVSFAVVALGVWVVTSIALRHYARSMGRDRLDDAAMVTVLALAEATVLLVGSLAAPPASLPALGIFFAVLWPVTLCVRVLGIRPLWAREAPLDEVLVVGVGALGRATADNLATPGSRRQVVGFLSLPGEAVAPQLLRAPVLGSSTDLGRILAEKAVAEVYIAGSATRQGEAMQATIRTCETYGVPFALPAYEFRLDRARLADPRAVLDGYLHYAQSDTKPTQHALKRLFDIVASGLALWLLLPLLAVVALAIKLTSRGPVFFKQVRAGVHGRPFHMLKFRSMVVNAEELKARLAAQNEQTGPVFKMKNDPRITGIGRFIRKYSIDELPQLINVLRGDMSVVGPRPPVPAEVAQYEPWQRRRLSVRPGLTCIWQVSGRNQISFEDWMYLDMQYIDHWSLSQDIGLILKTVPVVLTGRGAS